MNIYCRDHFLENLAQEKKSFIFFHSFLNPAHFYAVLRVFAVYPSIVVDYQNILCWSSDKIQIFDPHVINLYIIERYILAMIAI